MAHGTMQTAQEFQVILFGEHIYIFNLNNVLIIKKEQYWSCFDLGNDEDFYTDDGALVLELETHNSSSIMMVFKKSGLFYTHSNSQYLSNPSVREKIQHKSQFLGVQLVWI